jgi:hypothetical protein
MLQFFATSFGATLKQAAEANLRFDHLLYLYQKNKK